MDLALLGGSFNPPHVGHLLVATYVRATQPVDEVWLMPTFRHPFRKELTPFEDRVRMCQELAKDASAWLRVSEVEREVGGEGWTVETLEHLRKARPADRLWLIIGSDILADLPKWRDVERIRELAKLFVIHRAGYPAPEAVGPPLAEVSSTDIRARLARGEPVDDLVSRAVSAYARSRGLYGR